MSLTAWLLNFVSQAHVRLERVRLKRRWKLLQALGMHIGNDVWLPGSTWIDTSYCFLISIDDHCGFGEECLILAHDAQMDEFLDMAKVGRVTIHKSCHIGARTVILPGVEIGPRTIVGASSVVSRSLPAETVCAGNPARVICSLDEYLKKHQEKAALGTQFTYTSGPLSGEEQAAMLSAASKGSVYISGGRTAELSGQGGTLRTPSSRGDAHGT